MCTRYHNRVRLRLRLGWGLQNDGLANLGLIWRVLMFSCNERNGRSQVFRLQAPNLLRIALVPPNGHLKKVGGGTAAKAISLWSHWWRFLLLVLGRIRAQGRVMHVPVIGSHGKGEGIGFRCHRGDITTKHRLINARACTWLKNIRGRTRDRRGHPLS